MKEKRVFGNIIVGTWFCSKCDYRIFPNQLKNTEDFFTWSNPGNKDFTVPHCRKCDALMDYDEAA